MQKNRYSLAEREKEDREIENRRAKEDNSYKLRNLSKYNRNIKKHLK